MPISHASNGSSNGSVQNGRVPKHRETTRASGTGSDKDQIEHVLDLLYRGRWIILVVFLLVAGSVAAYTYSLAPIYESNSIVLVSKSQQPGAQQQQFNVGPRQPFARNDNSLTNELIILRNSMSLARGVASRLQNLSDVPETGAPLTILGSGRNLSTEQLARRVHGYVQFGTIGNESDAVTIMASSTVPSEAALIANLYTEEYVELTRDASRSRLAAQRRFLEEQEDKRQQELQEAESSLETYMRRENAMALDQEQGALVTQIAALEAQLDEANVELQTKQAALDTLEQQLGGVRSNITRRVSSGVDEELSTAQTQLSEVRARKEQILLRRPNLDPESDSLATINRRITELQRKVDQLGQQFVDEVRSVGGLTLQGGQGLTGIADKEQQAAQQRIEITGFKARQRVLEDRLQEYRAELQGIPAQAMDVAQLQRQRQYAERMHQFVTQRLQDTRIQEESEVGYADTVREALIPGEPVYPNTTRNLLAGIFGGLLLGIGLALARNVLDRRIFKPDDLHNQGESVIAVVPSIQGVSKSGSSSRTRLVEQDGLRLDAGLVSLLSPMAPAAESYRHLRTNIQFSFPDTVVETILVTSPNMGEGKSTTAANLAVVMAQAGRRTLLVDADLRRPRLHRALDLNREPGLVERLFDDGETTFSKDDAVATGIDNLYACPAGQSVHNPAELLGSRSMRAFVEQAREAFDVVIFDTPPVLVATDATLLSTQCDASIVVAKAGETRTHELNRCMESLDGVGATVIGTLLNGFDSSMAYGYDYKYRYYTQSYHEAAEQKSITDRLRGLVQRS